MSICTIRLDTLDFLDISLRTDTHQHIRRRISNPQSVPQSAGKITRGDERTQTDAVSACPGVTALLAAARREQGGVVRTLLDAGADVTVRTRNGLSLLSAALVNADRDLLRLYVDLAY